MIYAYLRVSTDKQDCDNQKQGVIRWLDYKGWKCDEWVIEEGVSGAKDYKARMLGKLVNKTQSGDWVIVSELSRLSRSMINTFELIKELSKKGVSVFCIKENMQISDDALGLMILSSFAFAAQVERERISQRTKEALTRAKENGTHLGRPFGAAHKMLELENFKDYIFKCVESGESTVKISSKLNVSQGTLRSFLKKYNIKTVGMLKYRENMEYKQHYTPKRSNIIYLTHEVY